VRPDVVYLVKSASGWKVIKPGLVFQVLNAPEPVGFDLDYYAPGTTRSVAAPVRAQAPAAPCPARTAPFTAPAHALQSQFGLPGSRPGDEPWLKIDAIAVARLSSRTVCFTLTLDGPPRPDSAYQIYLGSIAEEGPADRFDVEFDGLGIPHPLLGGEGPLSIPSLAGHLPRVFVAGKQLEIIATDPWFTTTKRFLVSVGADSLQRFDPLLRRPSDAGDLVPWGGCLVFPTGALDTKGLCGSTPSG
jgi:hypothetical protein